MGRATLREPKAVPADLPGDPPDGSEDAHTFIDAIVGAEDPLQLVVAGPGAGKTVLFKTVLEARVGDNLAVTFINALVNELDVKLAGLASVNTFHGFAKQLLHHLDVDGLTHHFHYLPASIDFVSEDGGSLLGETSSKEDVVAAFHGVDQGSPVLASYLRAASYYNVVGHDDAVYRVVAHLTEHPDDIPAKGQIVVDEVQDFNQLEISLISRLATTSRILAAGDDDQALYRFKHATPEHIRGLGHAGYTVYELPYCFRCPYAIIHAVHDVIKAAQKRHLLAGRIAKKYWTHPAKKADSDAHPKIRAVRCSVDNRKSPYPARYILREIGSVPADEIAAAWDGGYPSVMVIGPNHFLANVYRVLQPHFPNNIRWNEPGDRFDHRIEGYKLIAMNQHPRIGWRLVAFSEPPIALPDKIIAAVNADEDLDHLLDPAYVAKHSPFIETVRKLIHDEAVTDDEVSALQQSLGLPPDQLLVALDLVPKPLPPDPDKTLPEIRFTNFTTAKGLSADYVFVVGMVNDHFPRHPNAITDTEVCQFIVALTRTRKRCDLVTSARYADKKVQPSVFFSFIASSRFECVVIDKDSKLPN